jgi:hypothetical protein
LISTTAAAFVIIIGIAGMALAHGHMMGQAGMTPEQHQAAQDRYIEFEKKMQPLRKQLYAKRAELDALYYSEAPQNDAKIQSLIKDIAELDARLYAAHLEMRKQMGDQAMPYHGDYMGPGRGCGNTMGPGYGGHGWHGRMAGCGSGPGCQN